MKVDVFYVKNEEQNKGLTFDESVFSFLFGAQYNQKKRKPSRTIVK